MCMASMGSRSFVDAGFEHRLNLGVEVLVGVVDPLFYDATRDLVVFIVEDTNLSAVLCDENVQIGESRFSAFRTAFFGRFLSARVRFDVASGLKRS